MPGSLAPLGALLRTHATEFRDLVQNQLYATVLQSRQIFPMRAADSHLELAPALAWALERSDSSGEVSAEVLARMRRLGLDHRRHGFPPDLYDTFAQVLVDGVRTLADKEQDLPAELIDGAEVAIHRIIHAMTASVTTADRSGVPPAWVAEVVGVTKKSRRVSVVHLEGGVPFDYQPGQALPVSTNYLPGVWRLLTPATPANDYATLELHINAVDGGRASQFLANPRVGDYWSFGSGRGSVTLPESPCTVVAFGTGYAAAKALITARLGTMRSPVRLVLAAEYPGEIYDWAVINSIAQELSWLSVETVTAHADNPWWLRAQPLPVRPQIAATAADVVDTVLDDAHLASRETLLLGPAEAVDEAIVRLSNRGAPWHLISMLRYDDGPSWPAPFKF